MIESLIVHWSSLYGLNILYLCRTTKECLSPLLVQSEDCNSDEYTNETLIRKEISFSTICDGYVQLIPFLINGLNETECQYWICNNSYIHIVMDFWNCPNDADEVNCQCKMSIESLFMYFIDFKSMKFCYSSY